MWFEGKALQGTVTWRLYGAAVFSDRVQCLSGVRVWTSYNRPLCAVTRTVTPNSRALHAVTVRSIQSLHTRLAANTCRGRCRQVSAAVSRCQAGVRQVCVVHTQTPYMELADGCWLSTRLVKIGNIECL